MNGTLAFDWSSRISECRGRTMRSLASGGLSWPSLLLVVTQVDSRSHDFAQAPKYAIEQALL